MNAIIEKIRAEIERQEKQCPLDTYEGRHRLFILGGLKTFLSDLEKEEKPTTAEGDVFKEWGTTEKEYLDKSMEKVRLEMEIATYLKDWEEDEEIGLHLSTDNGCIPIELDDVRDLARHFAQWGAEHLKK